MRDRVGELGLVIRQRVVTRETGDDIGEALALPVLAAIPVMLTSDQRRRRRHRWAAIAMTAPCAAALAWLVLR